MIYIYICTTQLNNTMKCTFMACFVEALTDIYCLHIINSTRITGRSIRLKRNGKVLEGEGERKNFYINDILCAISYKNVFRNTS